MSPCAAIWIILAPWIHFKTLSFVASPSTKGWASKSDARYWTSPVALGSTRGSIGSPRRLTFPTLGLPTKNAIPRLGSRDRVLLDTRVCNEGVIWILKFSDTGKPSPFSNEQNGTKNRNSSGTIMSLVPIIKFLIGWISTWCNTCKIFCEEFAASDVLSENVLSSPKGLLLDLSKQIAFACIEVSTDLSFSGFLPNWTGATMICPSGVASESSLWKEEFWSKFTRGVSSIFKRAKTKSFKGSLCLKVVTSPFSFTTQIFRKLSWSKA